MFLNVFKKADAAGTPSLQLVGELDVITASGGSLKVNGSALAALELGYIDGVTAGTCTASKALVVDSNKAIDSFAISKRLSTSTIAGASVGFDATTDQYFEGMEMRWHVADWADTYTLTEATGLYLRMENRESNNAASIYGAQIYGVSNNVANTKYLWGGICYAYIKGAAGLTATGVYAFQPEISFDAETASSTITEAAVVRAKITGGTMAAYTNMHGYKLIAGDVNGGSRTYGNAFWVVDDSDMSGTCGWTVGLNLAAACTTGIAIESTTTAISFGSGDGKIVDAAASLSVYGGNTSGDSLILYGSSADTTSLSVLGTTGLSILGTVTTGLAISTASTSGVSITTSTPTQGILISAVCGSHAINISGAQTGAGITIASTCGTYGLNIAGACTTAAIKFGVGGGSIVDGAASLTVCGGDTARDDLILYGSSVVASRGTVMVGDFASSYTTPGQTGLGIPLGNATNADIRAFIVASTDGTIQPTKRIESSCHSFVQSMDWATTTLSCTALEGVFYGGFDLISTSDNINISGVGGWVYLNDESGYSTAGTTPVIGSASGKITYVAGVESFVTLPTSYEIKAKGVVCGLKLSNCFKAPGTNTGAGYTYNIYTETVDAVGYDYFWGTNTAGNGLIVNEAIPNVNTAYALKIRIADTDAYIPVFTDLSWGS
jgi:hypothetical protein